MANDIPQSNYESQQNYDIDIEKVYSDIIQEIDAARSVINISNPTNKFILNSLTKDSLTTLRQKLKVEQSAQESRCHAFLRLIGFPVYGQTSFYNPGLNIIRDPDKKITNQFKIDIAKSLIPGFKELSLFRETYLSDISKIFSSNESIDASALALSSSTAVRGFAAASEKVKVTYTSASDFEKNDQSYDVDIYECGLVGQYPGHMLLTQYMDAEGNKPTKLLSKRYHLVMPFMVDPIIDFSVSPNSRLVAVPFVNNKTNLYVSENTFVKRPLLEKVIRDRFATETPNVDSGTYSKQLQDFIQNNPAIQDLELINSISNSTQIYEQLQIKNYLNIILNMMDKLKVAQKKIREIQIKYYWIPIPSINGPEGGVKIRPIMSQVSKLTADANLITATDNALIQAILKNNINQANSQLKDINGIPDKGGFALEVIDTFTPETTTAYGDKTAQVIEDLTQKREQDMNDAGEALRIIEIIMGEFSGLGLCDIIAILGALYVMPKDQLIGFLDDDAFARAKLVLPELSNTSTQPPLVDTLSTFTNTVKDFYNLMDRIYLLDSNINS